MVNTAHALNAYTQTKVQTTSNPLDLIVMLYDGAIDFLDKASAAINMKETQVKIRYIDKTMAIIDELLHSLNIEAGGDVALNLQDLYVYMMKELLLANLKNDGDKVRQVASLLKELRTAWAGIKDKV